MHHRLTKPMPFQKSPQKRVRNGAQSIALRDRPQVLAEQCSALRCAAAFAEIPFRVDFDFDSCSQGSRAAPTLGWMMQPRWGRLAEQGIVARVELMRWEAILDSRTPARATLCPGKSTNGERGRSAARL